MFQFEGSINVLTQMMVDPAVTEKRGGGKNLPLRRGEILDVIEFTNKDQILCRNSQRRCKSVGTEALLGAGITAHSFQAVTAGTTSFAHTPLGCGRHPLAVGDSQHILGLQCSCFSL